jgi:hypothetical protein
MMRIMAQLLSMWCDNEHWIGSLLWRFKEQNPI